MASTIVRKKINADQLTKGDRKFWKALQESGRASFSTEDFRDIAKKIGVSERSTKRYVSNLRANGKLGIKNIYNLYY